MRYDIKKLELFCSAVAQGFGADARGAALFAQSLVNAEARGIRSHGLTRLSAYEKRVRADLVDVRARIRVAEDRGGLLLVDASNGMGAVTAHDTMALCIERAKKLGSCFAAVCGGNHFGYGAFFTEKAANAGMIGVAAANAPAAVAAIGGKEAVLGTNPLSIAVPAGKYRPMILDMATSVVARGKIRSAAKEGRPIPADWAVDASGLPTTDPDRAVTLLPFGGAKGYGIGLAIEILSACLSGALPGRELCSMFDLTGVQNSGFFLGALDVSRLLPLELFTSRVDALFDSIKGSERGEGVAEIFIPGEIEFNRQAEAEALGVELSTPVLRELEELSQRYGVAFACEKEA